MSNPGQSNQAPITSRMQLVEALSRGCKAASEWKIGTEHEKFGFTFPDAARAGRALYSPPPYRPEGIEELLKSCEGPDWKPILDQGNLIGLTGKGPHKGSSLSLEPAGQFELSGAPLKTLHDTKEEMDAHFEQTRISAALLGIGFAPLGFHPLCTRDEMPWMPKSRYAIMRRYMPGVGTRGLDMMTRTCTVQVNLDFSSEADMARKMRVSLALQPVATALFANSPFVEGQANGWLSNRARVWLDTDNDRSGQPSLFFDEDFGFEKYVDWVLDVPMYFVMRSGVYHDVAGCSFRKWLEGEEQEPLRGLTPHIGDFEDHLTTVFPDVRLKQFLEMRGADAGRPDMMLAQSAFWVGLLYDSSVLVEAEKLVKKHPWTVYQDLRPTVAHLGLDADFPGGLRAFTRHILSLAVEGLRARGLGEERYLDPLLKIGEGAPLQAQYWLERYRTVWNGDVRPIFEEAAVI
ncbi:glutamate--cysteine ligase [Acetobacteraceae bacterium ESL0709]|nr:glutamate--cysteine ligase [Acetobacteraceae bacterium ESL0697]MDF7678248.1 glutamate--cysteine ligase [Acetobacteraceae bacterium ESL0709]